MSSIKRTNHDTHLLKKDKSPAKNLTVLQKYLADNHTTTTSRPEKDASTTTKIPLKKPPADGKPQSKLPISTQNKPHARTSLFRSDKSPNKQKPSPKKPPAVTSKEQKSEKINEDNIKSLESFEDEKGISKHDNSSDDEQLVHMNRLLERFRNSKPLPREKRSNLTVKNLAQGSSSSSLEDDDDPLSGDETPLASMLSDRVNENKELASLKKQLNLLREKMFSNQKNIIDDEKTQRRQSSDDEIYGKLNIDALDLKAKYLIEKSESSLVDRANSSDGVGSSRSSSIYTSLSSNFQEPQPYKPEFLKYLENKTKINHSPETGEELRPEEDILYQWRLRRKMEEAKKAADLQSFKNATLTASSATSSDTHQMPLKTISNINIEKTKRQSPVKVLTASKQIDETVFTKSTSARGQEVQNYSSKQTTETQTSILIEAVDPKFLKPPPGHKKIEEEEGCEIDISIENEEPTRDTSNYLDIAVLDDNNSEKQEPRNELPSKKGEMIVLKVNTLPESPRSRPKKIKNNFLASSPIRQTKKHLTTTESNPKASNTSADLTKITVISDTTPYKPQTNQPKKASSPVNFDYPLIVKDSKSSKQYSLETCHSSQMPSVISSVSSSITNVTDSVPVGTSVANFKKLTISSAASNRTVDKRSDEGAKEYGNTSMSSSDLIDSDEILRILFKKNYFYQLKLKQIDELLTS